MPKPDPRQCRDRKTTLSHWAHNPKVVGSNPAPATINLQPGGHVASGLFRARSRCRTERGDAPRRRPGNSVLWIHIPSSYQAPDRCDRSLDSAPLALLINPNPINVSEDVGGETNRSPGATGSRSHGRRVQTLCSDRCSLDSPPLPVAFWVATMCLTLFLLPARPASIPSCADAPRTSGFRRRTAGGTRCGGTVLLAPRLAASSTSWAGTGAWPARGWPGCVSGCTRGRCR